MRFFVFRVFFRGGILIYSADTNKKKLRTFFFGGGGKKIKRADVVSWKDLI